MLKFNFYFITTDYCTIFGKNFKLKIIMEKEFKGTKGSWFVDNEESGYNEFGSLVTPISRIDPIYSKIIGLCDVYGDDEESKANAKLISKAPEMLAMLIKLRDKEEFEIEDHLDLTDLINEILD